MDVTVFIQKHVSLQLIYNEIFVKYILFANNTNSTWNLGTFIFSDNLSSFYC